MQQPGTQYVSLFTDELPESKTIEQGRFDFQLHVDLCQSLFANQFSLPELTYYAPDNLPYCAEPVQMYRAHIQILPIALQIVMSHLVGRQERKPAQCSNNTCKWDP